MTSIEFKAATGYREGMINVPKRMTSGSNYRVNVARLLNAYALVEGCSDYELTGTSGVLHHLPEADVQQLHELGYKVVYQNAPSCTMIYLYRDN